MLQYLPNGLTCLRLLLALPLGVMILRENYAAALAVALIAGLSDALDGFLARRLNALSRFGAIMDPIADKVLVAVCFICCAGSGLLPVYLAAVVIGRDLVIVTGALVYRVVFGPFQFAATGLSKGNMAVQIGFLMLLLTAQVVPWVPAPLLRATETLVIACAALSGLDYIVRWTRRALAARGGRRT